MARLLETMSDAVALFDEQGRLVFANRRQAEFFPETAEALVRGADFETLLRISVAAGSFLDAESDREAFLRDRLSRFRRAGDAVEYRMADGRWLSAKDERLGSRTAVIHRDITDRKRAQTGAAHRFRQIFEESPLPSLLLDAEGRATLVNRAAARLLRLPPGEPLYFRRMIQDELSRNIFDTLLREATRRRGGDWAVVALDVGGRAITVELAVRPLDDGPGEPGWAVLFQDVSAQDAVTRKLAESEQRNRGIVAAAIDSIVTIDGHGRIVDFNPAAEATFGYRATDVRGLPIGDVIVPPRYRKQHNEGMARLAGGAASRVLGRRIEIEAIRSNGEVFPVELAITQVPLASGPGFTAHIRDITESRRAQAEIASKTRILQDMMRAVDLGIAVFDSARCLAHCNQGYADLLDLPAEILAPNTRIETIEQFLQSWGAVAEEGDGLPSTDAKRMQTLRAPDGRILVRSTFAMEDGGIVQVVDDVTQQRHLQENLLQAQRMEALGQMAGGIAHELNNMLTLISGYARMASRGLGGKGSGEASTDREGGGDSLASLQGVIQRAGQITRELLTFSRQKSTEPKLVDLGAIILSQRLLLTPVLGERVRCDFQVPDSPVWVVLDPDLTAQALVNLAINARDAMPSGGFLRVLLSVEMRPGPDGTLAPWALLAVSDTGTGMPPEVKARIFEPFFTTKPVGQGTGLGLAMVYGTVTEAGGTIEVDSSPGNGTTFLIALPMAGAADLPAADPDTAGRGKDCSVSQLLRLALGDGQPQDGTIRTSRPVRDIVLEAAAGLFDLWDAALLVASVRSGPTGFAASLIARTDEAPVLDLPDVLRDGPAASGPWRISVAPPPGGTEPLTTLIQLHAEGMTAGPFSILFEALAPSVVAPLAGARARRVLLVEDNALLADLLADFLTAAGFIVVRAATGSKGYALARNWDFDVIVSDFGVPVIDGLSLFRAVRLLPDPRRAGLPFVLTSGSLSGALRTQAEEAGVSLLLDKPLDCDRLADSIAALCGAPVARPVASAPPRLGPEYRYIDPLRLTSWLDKLPLDRFLDLIGQVPRQFESSLVEAGEAASRGDHLACAGTLHRMMSAVGAIGMTSLARELAALEQRTVAGRCDVVIEASGSLRDLMVRSVEEVLDAVRRERTDRSL